MSGASGKCGFCNATADLRCSACYAVYYCGAKHQRNHWAKHRIDCQRPFEVRETPDLGCHLVAARDLYEDETILTENPFVVGPRDAVEIPNCIGCYAKIPSASGVPCPGCGWPSCNADCPKLKDPHYHGQECPLLLSLALFFGHQWEIVMILRCVLLQTRNPKMWKWIQELAPYAEAQLAKP